MLHHPPQRGSAVRWDQMRDIPARDGEHEIGGTERGPEIAQRVLPLHVRYERQWEVAGRPDYLRHQGELGYP
jgi:hypothetical protein